MKKIVKPFGYLLAGALLCSFIKKEKRHVFMAGDSTMAIKAENRYPETGWGVPFANMFQSDAVVKNYAKNGRSTLSFRVEHWWDSIYNQLSANDCVIIQFGHNDEKIEKVGTGTTIQEYKNNLAHYVADVRSKKAWPLLLTPIARRSFKDGVFTESHAAYRSAMLAVADSLQVPCLDITGATDSLVAGLGEQKSIDLFLHLPAGSTNYPNGVADNTHLNASGAATIANLISNKIKAAQLPLAKWLK